MSARRCSVIYLVPYIHSDHSGRLRSRGWAAAVLHEEQRSRPAAVLRPQDAGVRPQGGARVNTTLVLNAPTGDFTGFTANQTRLAAVLVSDTAVATTMAATPTSTPTPSRASTRAWPTSRPSLPHFTTPPTTAPLHRSVLHRQDRVSSLFE